MESADLSLALPTGDRCLLVAGEIPAGDLEPVVQEVLEGHRASKATSCSRIAKLVADKLAVLS